MPENSSKSYQVMKCCSKSNHHTCLNDGDVDRRTIGMTGNDRRKNINTVLCFSMLLGNLQL